MKYRLTTIAILMLAFFLKDAVTLVLVTGDMASAEMSASGPVAPTPNAPMALGPVALPLILPVIPDGTMAPQDAASLVPPASVEASDVAQLSTMVPMCHATPIQDQQTPLLQIGPSLQRVTTLGASGASGLEAILLGSIVVGVSSLLARRRAAWQRLVGFVPAVTVPPG